MGRQNTDQALEWNEEHRIRIKYLRNEAEQDGISLNPASERYFWRFVNSVCQNRRACLFLLDNGNLRAVWKDENDAQVGLQFRDDGMVQYVIFARSKSEDEITPAYGRVSIDTAILGQIGGIDLLPLVGA